MTPDVVEHLAYANLWQAYLRQVGAGESNLRDSGHHRRTKREGSKNNLWAHATPSRLFGGGNFFLKHG